MSLFMGSLIGDREKTNEPARGLIDRRQGKEKMSLLMGSLIGD